MDILSASGDLVATSAYFILRLASASDPTVALTLKVVVDDIEPICLGTNLNQSNALRPDQALMTFAGVFTYFKKHSNPAVASGMMERVEKRWKALDQPMFILALVLNPFEGIS